MHLLNVSNDLNFIVDKMNNISRDDLTNIINCMYNQIKLKTVL